MYIKKPLRNFYMFCGPYQQPYIVVEVYQYIPRGKQV